MKISTDDTDESLEVENILDDLNHSEEGCSDTCCTGNKKSIEDEDFPSYKTVVLDNAPLNSKTFRGIMIFILGIDFITIFEMTKLSEKLN